MQKQGRNWAAVMLWCLEEHELHHSFLCCHAANMWFDLFWLEEEKVFEKEKDRRDKTTEAVIQ